jgi:hypothetical protein
LSPGGDHVGIAQQDEGGDGLGILSAPGIERNVRGDPGWIAKGQR